MSKRNFRICLLYILHFTKDLENKEVCGWTREFRPELTGFILGFGFSSCFSKFKLLGFVSVPTLELFRTFWFHSSPLLFLPHWMESIETHLQTKFWIYKSSGQQSFYPNLMIQNIILNSNFFWTLTFLDPF